MGCMNKSVDPYLLAKGDAMICGYDAKWKDEVHKYEILAIEKEFTCPLVNPSTGASSKIWRLAGKVDGIIQEREEARRTLILEHKSTSEDISAGSDYWKKLRLDGQISIYYLGSDALGHRADGVLYDVIRKPNLRPLKATPASARKHKADGTLYAGQREADESPEDFRARLLETIAADPHSYYMQGQVVRLESEKDSALFDIWQLGKQIREAERAGFSPRNPDGCMRWGRPCEFFPVCTGEASLTDPYLYRQEERAHMELSVESGDNLLTSSRIATMRLCQKLHKYKYAQRYRAAVTPEALALGTLIHAGLASWWSNPDNRLDAALTAMREEPPCP